MLNVTPAACDHLEQLKQNSGAPSDMAIRLVHEDQNLKIKLDTKKDDDDVIHHKEQALVLLDPRTSEHVASHTLDVNEDRLVLQ